MGKGRPPVGELKARWKRVKFGDVVRCVRDRVDPATTGIARFVAGEHMDTDELRIRRWGEVDPQSLGPAFHMRFRPGNVLYGSRRTYLRKVCLADFEGICANTTFVLESANPQVLLPELLPFLMQAEGFHEHSKRESKGSVNPYVNFSDLAWYEFALPPLEEQRRVLPLLRAAADNASSLHDLVAKSAVLPASIRESLCVTSIVGNQALLAWKGMEGPWPMVRLGNLIELSRDTVHIEAGEHYQEIGVRSFGRGVFVKDPVIGSFIGDKRVFRMEPHRLVVNIIFAWEGALAITGAECIGLVGSHRFPTYVAKDDRVVLPFLLQALLSSDGLGKIRMASPGGAGRNRTLGQQAFLDIRIPVPRVDGQLEVVAAIQEADKAWASAKHRHSIARLQLSQALRDALQPLVGSA